MSREPISPGDVRAAGDVRPPKGAVTVAEWQPEVVIAPAIPAAEWDGTCTRLPLAYPVLRNQKVVGAGDYIVFSASKDPLTGRWIGPEATHVEDLFARGFILGTRAQEERAAHTAAVEHQRGVYQAIERDGDGNIIQRPMTELAARTTAQVQAEWERPLALHLSDEQRRTRELKRRERQESRSGEEGAEDVAAALVKLLAGQRRSPGAEGPGTAPTSGE